MSHPLNVIIAGSTKCGTTSLFQYLSQHPRICASVIKETRFFWEGDYKLQKPLVNGNEPESYHDFFPDYIPEKIRMEATPDYLYSAKAAKKIQQQIPGCKLIFILRNPLDRIISWYKYSKQRGHINTNYSFDEYMNLLLAANPDNSPQHLRAMEQGRYGKYLQVYFNLFSKENIYVAWYEELQNAPANLMKTICDFLCIDNAVYDNFDFKVYNPSLNVSNPGALKKYITLKKFFRRINNKLPQVVRNIFKKIAKPVDAAVLKSKTKDREEINLSLQHRNILNDYFSDDYLLLEKLLNRKITWQN